MVYKRVSKIIFAAILAVTVFSGCGNRQEEKIDKTETETTTQKSTQDSTQDVTQEAEEETKYPSITSDGKIKDYKSVVTVDDTAYELYTYLDKTKLFFRAEFPDTVIQKRLKNRCILRTDCNDLTRCNQNTKRYGRIRFFFMTDLDRRDIDQNESITIL
jgi:outer membrane murein-binding lipoprotein Lpp